MGTSGDMETAIAEGATIIKVGTAIFGQRTYPDSYYWNENIKLLNKQQLKNSRLKLMVLALSRRSQTIAPIPSSNARTGDYS